MKTHHSSRKRRHHARPEFDRVLMAVAHSERSHPNVSSKIDPLLVSNAGSGGPRTQLGQQRHRRKYAGELITSQGVQGISNAPVIFKTIFPLRVRSVRAIFYRRPTTSSEFPLVSPRKQIPAGGYGEDQNLRYLIMTRLGPDVDSAQQLTGPWSVAQKAGYARQMLALLRSLHSECKMVFVDVKPGESW